MATKESFVTLIYWHYFEEKREDFPNLDMAYGWAKSQWDLGEMSFDSIESENHEVLMTKQGFMDRMSAEEPA